MKFWNKSIFRWQLIAFLGISAFVGFSLHTHLDEFILFVDLAYRNPNYFLNQFPNGYQAFVKHFPLGLEANLPYAYLGNVQRFLFLPFYLLLPLELAKPLYSFSSLLVIYYLMIDSFKLKGYQIWMLILFLPIYVTVLHDSGPVNVGIISFFLSKRFVERIFSDIRKWERLMFGALLALLWSIAFFDKQFYLYLFPGVILFSLVNIRWANLLNYRVWGFILPVFVFLAFVVFYLKGETQIKEYEADHLVSRIVPTKSLLGGSPDVILLLKFIRHFPDTVHLWPSLDALFQERLMTFATYLNSFDFSFYLIRNLNVKEFKFITLGSNFSISTWLFFLALISLFCRYVLKVIKRGIKQTEFKTIFYFLSFLTLSFTFIILGKVRSPHHFIYLWIPLFGFVFDNGYRLDRSLLFLVYYSFNVLLGAYNLVFSGPEEHIVDDYQSIVSYTRRDDPSFQIINFDSWSHSFTRVLDNPNNHLVTWIDLRDERQLNQLIHLSDSLHRPIIEVSQRLDWGFKDKPLTVNERMNFFKQKGFKVKQINRSTNIPIFIIQR
jgi:hypothetical protein